MADLALAPGCLQDFLRPIVTPFELELALTSKSWTGDYILDFTQLLTTSDFGQDHVDPSLSDHDEEGPVFSSVTGKYRMPKRYVAHGVTGTPSHSVLLSIAPPSGADQP